MKVNRQRRHRYLRNQPRRETAVAGFLFGKWQRFRTDQRLFGFFLGGWENQRGARLKLVARFQDGGWEFVLVDAIGKMLCLQATGAAMWIDFSAFSLLAFKKIAAV